VGGTRVMWLFLKFEELLSCNLNFLWELEGRHDVYNMVK